MSSKPGAGINHKEYGVTSEGVHAWLPHVAELADINLDDFTVTMTGGPDGDVGGNLLKILHREHGKRCRVLAIGDGTGAAYDPDGLAWRELLVWCAAAKASPRSRPSICAARGPRSSLPPIGPGPSSAMTCTTRDHRRCVRAVRRPPVHDQRAYWRQFLDEEGVRVARP